MTTITMPPNQSVDFYYARINYSIQAAKVWSIYSQRVVAGVLPEAARARVYELLHELKQLHPIDDRGYCDAYEAHVKRVFREPLKVIK